MSEDIFSAENKLTEEVRSFIDKCARRIAIDAESTHSCDLINECVELISDSPIEQIFYCALKTQQKIWRVDDNAEGLINFAEGQHIVGLTISPQYQIGKYRVDFYLQYENRRGSGWFDRNVIIECDSQAFHERSERERSYEKARDRFLQTKGYKVFRFTGAEIMRDPMQIADEVLSFLLDVPDLPQD